MSKEISYSGHPGTLRVYAPEGGGEGSGTVDGESLTKEVTSVTRWSQTDRGSDESGILLRFVDSVLRRRSLLKRG